MPCHSIFPFALFLVSRRNEMTTDRPQPNKLLAASGGVGGQVPVEQFLQILVDQPTNFRPIGAVRREGAPVSATDAVESIQKLRRDAQPAAGPSSEAWLKARRDQHG